MNTDEKILHQADWATSELQMVIQRVKTIELELERVAAGETTSDLDHGLGVVDLLRILRRLELIKRLLCRVRDAKPKGATT